VFRKVQSDLDRPILGIGCSAHIVHNSVQTACDSLPLDIEFIVIKIYKYFHIYTVRVMKLKEFCEFVKTDYKKILSHSSTRFLSLFKVFQKTDISCCNIYKMVEFAMSLPGTSAPVERVFSIMGNIWSAERGRLSISTVKHLLNVKINSELSCYEFYDVIKTNKPFLKEVMSSEKYN
jgi:hypothetical protein